MVETVAYETCKYLIMIVGLIRWLVYCGIGHVLIVMSKIVMSKRSISSVGLIWWLIYGRNDHV